MSNHYILHSDPFSMQLPILSLKKAWRHVINNLKTNGSREDERGQGKGNKLYTHVMNKVGHKQHNHRIIPYINGYVPTNCGASIYLKVGKRQPVNHLYIYTNWAPHYVDTLLGLFRTFPSIYSTRSIHQSKNEPTKYENFLSRWCTNFIPLAPPFLASCCTISNCNLQFVPPCTGSIILFLCTLSEQLFKFKLVSLEFFHMKEGVHAIWTLTFHKFYHSS